jgi:hypothetical protein
MFKGDGAGMFLYIYPSSMHTGFQNVFLKHQKKVGYEPLNLWSRKQEICEVLSIVAA